MTGDVVPRRELRPGPQRRGSAFAAGRAGGGGTGRVRGLCWASPNPAGEGRGPPLQPPGPALAPTGVRAWGPERRKARGVVKEMKFPETPLCVSSVQRFVQGLAPCWGVLSSLGPGTEGKRLTGCWPGQGTPASSPPCFQHLTPRIKIIFFSFFFFLQLEAAAVLSPGDGRGRSPLQQQGALVSSATCCEF